MTASLSALLPEFDQLSTASDSPPPLSALNVMYDVARPQDLTSVICEAGLIPPASVPIILRDFKPLAAEV